MRDVRVGQLWMAKNVFDAAVLRVEKISGTTPVCRVELPGYLPSPCLERFAGGRVVCVFPEHLSQYYDMVSKPPTPEPISSTPERQHRIEVTELREALKWAIRRLNIPGLIDEGCGRVPDRYHEVTQLAYGYGDKKCAR